MEINRTFNEEQSKLIYISLNYRLEQLEESLEDCKKSEDIRFKEFINRKEKEIKQLKELIDTF